MKCCDGACTDTSGDPLHCGACGTTCAVPNGRPRCVAGACMPSTCNRGWADCDKDPANGCETNLRVDPKNCTACGNVCALRNVLPACADGCYLGACAFGFDDCNGMVADGCETSVSGDVNNCGACGIRCGSVPNAKNACISGACQLTGCNNGYSDCDGNVMNGCEILSNSDARNCGACGNACAQGAVCIGGVCTCPPCNFPNAKARCAGVQCVIDVCNPNYGNCDGNSANGCERRIDGDISNCGACGNVCPMGLVCVQGSCTCPMCNIPNAKSVCVNNACVFDSCLPDYGNCDMNAGNGCEVDLRADAKNCGACGKACPQNAPFCTGGVCNNILASCLDYSQGGGQMSGIFNIDPDGGGPVSPFAVWCDMETDGGGWTLVARVSGDDAANWMLDTGEWWYDRVMEAGTPTSRNANADALSAAFWTVKATELKITRSDNNNDAYLFISNGNCLGGQTLREKITGYGNFRNGVIWGVDTVKGTCPGLFGNNYANTAGFAQAKCAMGLIGGPDSISFWADFGQGDGAVIMIGGGGGSCSRADHGIGVTEANSASFTDGGTGEADFGNDAGQPGKGFSLNLFVR